MIVVDRTWEAIPSKLNLGRNDKALKDSYYVEKSMISQGLRMAYNELRDREKLYKRASRVIRAIEMLGRLILILSFPP